MKNIELKVKVSDRVSMIRLIRKLEAKKERVLHQTDTYFTVPNGRLKLRETKGENDVQLIFYSRRNEKVSRFSEYDILRIPKGDAKKLKGLLEDSLSVKVVVKKERTLFMYGNTRIHLDRVFGLGDYLELETVMKGQSLAVAKKEHTIVIEALGLNSCERIPVSYSDLLMLIK